MSFGSAGYTPTFSGDLSTSAIGAGRRAADKLRKALRRKRILTKLEERKKARTPQQKQQVEKKDVEEQKEDAQVVKEVEQEVVKEEKKEQKEAVSATQKLLPSAARSSTSSASNGVIPVTVRDVSGKQQTALLPSAKSPALRKGGGIAPMLPPATPLLSPANDSIQKTTAIVQRNNDAIISAIQGEVVDVKSAIIDVSYETVETNKMMETLVDQEKDQTDLFKKQADILNDSVRFKKRQLLRQLIFNKQQKGKERKDVTGAAALAAGGAGAGALGGGGGGFNIPGLGPLAPLAAAAGLLKRIFDGVRRGFRSRPSGSSIGSRLSGAARRGRNFLGRQFNRGRNFLGRQFNGGTNALSRFGNLIQRRMYGLNQYTQPIGPMPLDSGPRGVGNWAKAGAGEVGDVYGNVPRAQSSVQAGTPRKPPQKPPLLQKLKAKSGGIMDKIFDLVPGLKGAREKLKGLTLKKAVTFLNNNVVGTINGIKKGGNAVAKFALKAAGPIVNPFVKGLGFLTKMVAAPAKFLKGALAPVLKVGKGLARVLGPILDIGFFALDTKSRLDSGYSPARAILPLIPRTLLTMGGAALGGTVGAAGGPLAAVGAMGGGFLGSLLGDQVVKFIDGSWNDSWDQGIFKSFNEGAYGLLADKLGYMPPRSEQEALDRDIEAEALKVGNDPREYQGYSGAYDSASMQAERPDRATGGFATRLGDAASKFIYSKFGMRNGKMHKGLDISGGPYVNGAPLTSLLGGRVAMAEDLGRSGWGKYVVLNHANGTSSLYGHLSKYFVKNGDMVEPGQVIGNIGSTGRSEGPHLHFELGSRWNGGMLEGHVDPKGHIDQYVSVAGGVGSDAISFNAPEGTASQNAASILNSPTSSAASGMQIAVQLPPNIYPMQDGNVDNPGGPTLERVNNELLYLQNVEQRVLVG